MIPAPVTLTPAPQQLNYTIVLVPPTSEGPQMDKPASERTLADFSLCFPNVFARQSSPFHHLLPHNHREGSAPNCRSRRTPTVIAAAVSVGEDESKSQIQNSDHPATITATSITGKSRSSLRSPWRLNILHVCSPVNRILVAVAVMSEKNQEASTAAVALLPVLLSGDP